MERQDESLIKDKHARNTFQEVQEEAVAQPVTIEGLHKAIRKQPLNKPIYRKILIRLQDEATTEEMEGFISDLVEFKYAVQPEGRFLEILERVGGIERTGRVPVEPAEALSPESVGCTGTDAPDVSLGPDDMPDQPSGNTSSFPRISPQKGTPSLDGDQDGEGEDDSLRGVIWKTTALGEEYLADTEPSNRLHTLFEKEPDRVSEYQLIMNACARGPKKLKEIIEELEGGSEGKKTSVHPSVYLDRLEAVGMIVWNEAWELTEEGRGCLAETL